MKKLYIMVLCSFFLSSKGFGQTSTNGGIYVTSDLVAARGDISGLWTWSEANAICNELVDNNFSDWRLPSKEELNFLYELHSHGSGNFKGMAYWSSTDVKSGFKATQFFHNGSASSGSLGGKYSVRCVRNSSKQAAPTVKKTIEEPTASDVKIGEQIWTTKNLNTDKFRNEDKILFATNMVEWKKFGESSTPAWCYYDFNELNGTKFGKLYNYFAVVDPRGIADEGWHIPSNEEWTELEDYIGNNFTSYGRPVGKENAGRQMKVSGFGNDPVGEGTYNWSKFYGTPGGWLDNGSFKNINHNGYWFN